MKVSKLIGASVPVCGAMVVASLSAGRAAAAPYAGNGATGFGGAVGNGNLVFSESASGLTVTFNRGTGNFDDDLVVYLDTQAGGFTDTSTFSDNADGGREAISGYNATNVPATRTLVTFPTGFAADYALSIQNGFIGVFGLASGGNNALTYQFGQGQSGADTDPSYSITLSPVQEAQIGITPGSTFAFDGTYISTSAYRSNESIGASTVTNPDASGNGEYSNPITFSTFNTFTTAVPEPTSLAVIGVGGLALAGRRRRAAR